MSLRLALPIRPTVTPPGRPGPGAPLGAAPPADPPRGPVAVATAPARLTGEVLLALPYVVAQVPPLVQDLRVVVGALARLAAEDGELTALLRETARLAGTHADD